MLASVIAALALAMPIVRTKMPMGPFWQVKTCSTRDRTADLAAFALRIFSGMGRPFGFLRWMRLSCRRS